VDAPVHVAEIGITAIKGFGLSHPDSVRIESTGVLSIGSGDEVLLEDEVERDVPLRAHLWGTRHQDAHTVPGPWSDLASELAGARVRLVRATTPSGAVDVEPATP
jgi:hypothetical protein